MNLIRWTNLVRVSTPKARAQRHTPWLNAVVSSLVTTSYPTKKRSEWWHGAVETLLKSTSTIFTFNRKCGVFFIIALKWQNPVVFGTSTPPANGSKSGNITDPAMWFRGADIQSPRYAGKDNEAHITILKRVFQKKTFIDNQQVCCQVVKF